MYLKKKLPYLSGLFLCKSYEISSKIAQIQTLNWCDKVFATN